MPHNEKLLFQAYGTLGGSSRLIGNDSLSLVYDNKALGLGYAANDENMILGALTDLAALYSEKGDWRNLDTILTKVFSITGIRKKYKRSYIYLNGIRADEMISHQKDTMSGISIYREIITDCKEIKYFPYMSYTGSKLSKIYTLRKNKDSAYYFGISALDTAMKYNLSKEINDANDALFKEALKYRLLYDSMYQQTYNPKAIQDAESSRNQFEQEKREAVSKLEQEKKDAKTQHMRDIQFTALGIFLLVAAFFYWNSRQKQKAKNKIEKAYSELKSTQAQLIQSEKMASLGELTAGIAHEIQNPLNFVNNFSDVNQELISKLVEEVDKGNTEEVKAIANDIKDNEQKINHHGKRADAIVKGMLQHSRVSSGQKELTDINALADEYLRLSYHGLRAKDKSFNATMKTDFDESIGKINVIPQDIGRVLLNLFNNAFYAINQQKSKNLISYEPTVSVTTKKSDNHVIITVSDNGNGIHQKVVDKIFQPFFTTKPTGEGTGLGLSLAYDIVKAHGGELKVESKEGKGSEFIIALPVG